MPYAVTALSGPLGYCRTMANALAFWNYLEFGAGQRSLADLGIDPSDLKLVEVKFMDDDEAFMEWVHLNNEQTYKERRLLDISTPAEALPARTDQTQGDGEKVLAGSKSD